MTSELDELVTAGPEGKAHPICRLLRELRHAAGLSLADVKRDHHISDVVLGAYERGDRNPPLQKLSDVLAVYGYQLQAVPVGSSSVRLPNDMVADLRAIADQIESRLEVAA